MTCSTAWIRWSIQARLHREQDRHPRGLNHIELCEVSPTANTLLEVLGWRLEALLLLVPWQSAAMT